MSTFDNVPLSPVRGGRREPCAVCCLGRGHDCDLVEYAAPDGRRVLLCLGPGCDACGFEVPRFSAGGREITGEEIREAAMRRIAELERMR